MTWCADRSSADPAPESLGVVADPDGVGKGKAKRRSGRRAKEKAAALAAVGPEGPGGAFGPVSAGINAAPSALLTALPQATALLGAGPADPSSLREPKAGFLSAAAPSVGPAAGPGSQSGEAARTPFAAAIGSVAAICTPAAGVAAPRAAVWAPSVADASTAPAAAVPAAGAQAIGAVESGIPAAGSAAISAGAGAPADGDDDRAVAEAMALLQMGADPGEPMSPAAFEFGHFRFAAAAAGPPPTAAPSPYTAPPHLVPMPALAEGLTLSVAEAGTSGLSVGSYSPGASGAGLASAVASGVASDKAGRGPLEGRPSKLEETFTCSITCVSTALLMKLVVPFLGLSLQCAWTDCAARCEL